MVEPSELEGQVLEFVHKSFGFERVVNAGGSELAVFSRRETESESKFRPKVIRLFVVVPRAQLLYDLATELIAIAPDGVTPGPRGAGTAVEAAAGTTQFTEQGIAWVRETVPNGLAYLPKDRAATLRAPAVLRELGLA